MPKVENYTENRIKCESSYNKEGHKLETLAGRSLDIDYEMRSVLNLRKTKTMVPTLNPSTKLRNQFSLIYNNECVSCRYAYLEAYGEASRSESGRTSNENTSSLEALLTMRRNFQSK